MLVSGYLMAEALKVNLRLTDEDRRLYTPVAAADLDRALVLLPPMWGPHLLHPFAWLQNDVDYDGATVYALDRGEPANLALLREYPEQKAYRLLVHGRYRANPPDPNLTTSLERLTIVARDSLEMGLMFENPTTERYVHVGVSVGGRAKTFVLDSDSHRGKSYEGVIRVGADGGVELDGRVAPVDTETTQHTDPDGLIRVSISVKGAEASRARTLYERQLAYVVEGPSLKVLLPGVISTNELGADPVTVEGT